MIFIFTSGEGAVFACTCRVGGSGAALTPLCSTEGSGFKPQQPSEGERWNEGKDDALEHLGVEERINRLFEIIIRFSGSLQTCPLPTWSSVLLTVCYLLPTLTSLCLSYYSDMIKPKGKSISFKASSETLPWKCVCEVLLVLSRVCTAPWWM